MAIEIERKFLMDLSYWDEGSEGVPYRQGYLAVTQMGIVRVRIKGEIATLTVKSKGTDLSREEFEYEIPMDDAETMLNLCQNDIIEKTRYKVMAEGKLWDVDEFHGKNNGLWLAEVELKSENEPVTLPKWALEEVTGDEHYYNAYLSKHPFSTWHNE
ncbi:MAG: CYTH domain-containing protein [Candidatus Marinimicrobia bacterium]|jgi:CYTH domain-containing protein|nr:CYTH domain-containing protein [Candidatus Neomarinimicrobiota bacterium]MBT3676506.1 CYTH domain-containing protein [Candidatus Neomarinimicrobiota bacterium]MBT4067743.1 CYTH domain-containing protein [Candidatus Neomarinimicrobiota bacterium]MBT4271111.1 CYTH domain-containing protein [Candidatus Neomarinimicrobiota bacterium]MBT4372146.1 CYTH domain-containing protein [Candidatus Neomarinimicrobiota bacterium]